MLRVGLTGGLACGKSFVGHALEKLGCHLIQADELGHEVLLPGAEAYDSVVNEFGREILDYEGTIDRGRLAAIVFGDAAKLARLSSFIHPAVLRREEEIMRAVERIEPDAIMIVEAAILVETGSYLRFDKLIVVICDPEQQVQRAMKRGVQTMEQVMDRIRRQLPPEEKRRLADYIIDTSGSKEQTLEQVRGVYESLRKLQQQ